MDAPANPNQPPQDPFALAQQISTDPVVPDEQKLEMLTEIGRGVGVDVDRINTLQRIPVSQRAEIIAGHIARNGEASSQIAELQAEAKGYIHEADTQLAKSTAEIAARLSKLREHHEPRIAEADAAVHRAKNSPEK
ncbi:MAG: hypothetical protein US77_C0004G0005 [Microgenomates group bacterium GW2011_GWC1_38_14]|nr:MAG: hypothetical protein US07_C0006G0004 [Candidatus Levybacteria bacterium GW2011_GWB1_36_18]KKQ58292.1 MAG: hypothetical protein US77_C0004G0005 [Microgenomates group bacterium GW2011_GWC1_38_14]OGH43829.1 MAG: hypothetical protein A3I49_00025 [Candidatus Levybacteria bacterium RIFCSPLOWO2_02_FULL_37_11]